MYHRPKYKANTIKFLQKTGEYLYNIEAGKDFLGYKKL